MSVMLSQIDFNPQVSIIYRGKYILRELDFRA